MLTEILIILALSVSAIMDTKAEVKPVDAQIIQEPRYSDYEIGLLERVVMSEASIESYDCKVAVCETILNRCDIYGQSIEEVVTTPYQYSMADNGYPNQDVKDAVAQATRFRTYDKRMIYFRQDYYHRFGEPYQNFGTMYFSLKGDTE